MVLKLGPARRGPGKGVGEWELMLISIVSPEFSPEFHGAPEIPRNSRAFSQGTNSVRVFYNQPQRLPTPRGRI